MEERYTPVKTKLPKWCYLDGGKLNNKLDFIMLKLESYF